MTILEMRQKLRQLGIQNEHTLSDAEVRSLFYILTIQQEGTYECMNTIQ